MIIFVQQCRIWIQFSFQRNKAWPCHIKIHNTSEWFLKSKFTQCRLFSKAKHFLNSVETSSLSIKLSFLFDNIFVWCSAIPEDSFSKTSFSNSVLKFITGDVLKLQKKEFWNQKLKYSHSKPSRNMYFEQQAPPPCLWWFRQ